MGYYIRALAWKKSSPAWKVQFVSYKKSDVAAGRLKKEWDVDKGRWRSLGFNPLMTQQEARARAKQLNARKLLKDQERRIQLQNRIKAEQQTRHENCLPIEFVTEFENRFLRVRDSETAAGKRKKSRARIIWAAAQKMVVAVGVDPSDWFYFTHEIYDYFHRNRFSVRYAGSILKIANLWGFFLSKKLGHAFLPVPPPRGYERMRLIEANYEKDQNSIRKASMPLSPGCLESIQSKLNQKNYNWLFLSVWFGLRPQEIDNLRCPDFWQLESLPSGRKVLWVYQTKIVALPPEDRWKPIPILYQQQEAAFRILEAGDFKRPILKTMRTHFGPGIRLYGGRKGFSDLMLSKGHSLENISVWMGHSTLDRTWRSYKSRRKFHLAS